MAKKVDVSVRVQWPSKEAKRKLPQDSESPGEMLIRGAYRQITHATWKNSSVQKEIMELMRKDIETEASPLCSKKEPSSLQKTNKESMLKKHRRKSTPKAEPNKNAQPILEQWLWQPQFVYATDLSI